MNKMNPFIKFKSILEKNVSEKTILDLQKKWSENHRVYHNTSHLTQILIDIEKNIWFNELSVPEKIALLLASFFHDAIFDPLKKDNEDRSIKYFNQCYIGKDLMMQQKVVELIEATKYRKRPNNKLQRIFWEADNAGFKKGFEVLLKVEKQIKKEYSHIPISKYKKGRLEFLDSNIGLFDEVTDRNINKLIEYIEKTY